MKCLKFSVANLCRNYILLLLVLPVFMLSACASTPLENQSPSASTAGKTSQEATTNAGSSTNDLSIAAIEEDLALHEQEWGVKVIGLRPSAAGYMLDFRYRVLDAKKAAELVNRKNKPYLLVEKDGSKLVVPVTSKLGPLRQSAQYAKENRNYFMFFANPNKHVKSGDLVTVVIGDFKAEHLVVN
ncbi:hypothetical protein [Kaarinaea lacus]